MEYTMWWNNLTDELAEQFLEECYEATQEIVKSDRFMNYRIRLENVIDKTFVPQGAIISATNTTDSLNALRASFLGSYGFHFIVTRQTTNYSKYPLLKDLPTLILVPTEEKFVAHSGYMSPYTWGIQLTNVGKLRQIKKNPFNNYNPVAIPYNEENDKVFRSDLSINNYVYYQWRNCWTEFFTNNVNDVRPYGSYVFEEPHYKQIKSLVILLKVLNHLNPMDRRFVLPYHCIDSRELNLPTVDWSFVRRYVFDKDITDGVIDTQEFKSKFAVGKCVDSIYDNFDNVDEYYIKDINGRNRTSRSAIDLGEFDFINDDDMKICETNKYSKAYLVEMTRMMISLGYDEFNNFTLRQLINSTKNENELPNFIKYCGIDARKFVRSNYERIRGTLDE